MRHLIRACVELGTDALKIAAPAQLSQLPELLEGVHEHTPVFFAGGEKCSDEQLLALAREGVAAGATGLCVGRNVFQREPGTATLDRLQEIVVDRPGEASPSPVVMLQAMS
jgi:class I fructose-bisphosphate aldolase/fructose-bisphosphate aldolase/2-amino-3,7-dideoxy-D-threo-hept-6-ulosonate synthase